MKRDKPRNTFDLVVNWSSERMAWRSGKYIKVGHTRRISRLSVDDAKYILEVHGAFSEDSESRQMLEHFFERPHIPSYDKNRVARLAFRWRKVKREYLKHANGKLTLQWQAIAIFKARVPTVIRLQGQFARYGVFYHGSCLSTHASEALARTFVDGWNAAVRER